MKKYFGALLLLPLVLLAMAQFAGAQDTMSAVLSSPYNSRPGSSLVYFFTEGTIASGDNYKSFLTITNTSVDISVLVHYQFYNIVNCTEVFDYVDILTPQGTKEIDPFRITTINDQYRGSLTGNRYLLTATAVDATTGQGANTQAVSFNWLTGQQFITNTNAGTAYGGNAISRMAVNGLGGSLDHGFCYIQTPKDFPAYPGTYAIGDSTWVPPTAIDIAAGRTLGTTPGCNTSVSTYSPGYTVYGWNGRRLGNHQIAVVDADWGTYTRAQRLSMIRVLQMFRPLSLIVPHFFAPSTVTQANNGTSLAFGNRMSMVSVYDSYNDALQRQYKLVTNTLGFTPYFVDTLEMPWSLPRRDQICVTEWVLSPRAGGVYVAGSETTVRVGGIGYDFIGQAVYSAVDKGGWLKLNVATTVSPLVQASTTTAVWEINPMNNASWFGWFSQSLSNPASGLYAGVGDLLVGLGRYDVWYRYASRTRTYNTVTGDYSYGESWGTLPASEAFYNKDNDGLVFVDTTVAAGTITP